MKTCIRVLCAMLLSAGVLLAQPSALTPPAVDRLPADTWVLFTWHGAAAANKVRDTNPVMLLWRDPQFVTVREQLVKKLVEEIESERKEGEESLTREDIEDILSVLENPVIAGVTGNPFEAVAGVTDTVHVFAILNKKGKEDVVARLDKKKKPKPNSEISTYTFRGVEIKKTVTTTVPEPAKPSQPMGPEEGKEAEQEPEPPEPKITYDFDASLGDYKLFSDHQEVMESLITRLQEKTAPTESLLQNAAYRSAQRFRSEGALAEVFVKIPDLGTIPYPPNPQIDIQTFVRELHFERIQALWLSAGMAPDRMVLRGAVLGDTTPGSLFDIVGSNVAEFQTLAAAPVSGSYGAFRIDLAALYATIKRAAQAALPPEQAASADMVDGIVAMQTGMPLKELLGLFPGEIGTVSTGDEQLADILPNIIMVPVTEGEPVLGLLRTLAGTYIRSEETISGATVVTMGPPPPAEEGGTRSVVKPFYVAVSPKMLVVSPGKAQLGDILARCAAGMSAPAGSLAADGTFRSVRKAMPAELNGLTYSDMSRYPWDKQREQMRKQFAKQKQETLDRADAVEKGDENNPPDPKKAEELRKSVKTLEEMEPMFDALFPLMKKYFKISAGASWKAPDGVFLHSYIN